MPFAGGVDNILCEVQNGYSLSSKSVADFSFFRIIYKEILFISSLKMSSQGQVLESVDISLSASKIEFIHCLEDI